MKALDAVAISFGALIGIGTTVGAVMVGYSYVQVQLERRGIEAVAVTVAYDPERCTSERPLLSSISNGSNYTVVETSFRIVGHREGYSNSVHTTSISTDRIIASGDSWDSCWPSHYLGSVSSLVWTTTNIRPTFRRAP